MTGYMNPHKKIRGGHRILTPHATCVLVVILLATVCILPVTGANVTATATAASTTAPTTSATTTATTAATTTVTTSPTATHTTTQTTVATTTATTTATASSTTAATTSATTTATTTATTAATTTATTTSINEVQPVAGFTADTVSGLPPLTVQFTDLSTGGPVSWTWDFGDGDSDTSQNPSHTYTDAGTYTVTLTAVNRQGTSYQHSESGYITVDEATATPTDTTTTDSSALAAAFSGYPLNGTGTLTVEFTDSSTGSPDGWSWDFGDGTTSTDENPSHLYTNPGLYTVSLEITKSGETDETTKVSYITINAESTGYATVNPTSTNSLNSLSGSGSGNSQVYSHHCSDPYNEADPGPGQCDAGTDRTGLARP